MGLRWVTSLSVFPPVWIDTPFRGCRTDMGLREVRSLRKSGLGCWSATPIAICLHRPGGSGIVVSGGSVVNGLDSLPNDERLRPTNLWGTALA